MSKVTIYTGGFFHLPIVTEAVRKSFSEVALHSSYPGFYLKKRLHKTIDFHPHISKEIASKFPVWFFNDRPYQLSQIFQSSIKGSLKTLTSDLVIGWAGHTLSVAEVCAVKQIPFLLERGSTHIRWQRERLKIAYRNSGLPENDVEVPSEKYVIAQEKEYELANRIHVPTPLCLRSFKKYCSFDVSQKIRITKYGFNFSSMSQSRKNLTRSDTIKFLFAGTLSVRKGFFDYCTISKKVSATKASFTAVGRHDDDTKKIIEKFEPNILIKTSQSKEDLFTSYYQHDVLIICSYEEGLSMIIPEAMSQGMVIIGTSDSGLDEYITNGVNGFILNAGNIEEFLDVIFTLLKDPDVINKMRHNIRNNNTDNLLNDYIDQYDSSIAELMSSN
jgi:glycosyltransferase involved in cell wall biosynthesis